MQRSQDKPFFPLFTLHIEFFHYLGIRTKMEYRKEPILTELLPERMHEACGLGRFAFAAMRMRAGTVSIIWIVGPHSVASLCPAALSQFFDPARLVVMHPPKPKEALWCMEEALRSGPAFVVADLATPADLTQSRRLQLAAQAGGSTGLCLVPDGAINNAAETRWRCTPLPCEQGALLHRWELIKNKRGILKSWNVGWDDVSRSVRVVSASGSGTNVTSPECIRSGTPLCSGRDAQERLAALLAQHAGGEAGINARYGVDRCTSDPAELDERPGTTGEASILSGSFGTME